MKLFQCVEAQGMSVGSPICVAKWSPAIKTSSHCHSCPSSLPVCFQTWLPPSSTNGQQSSRMETSGRMPGFLMGTFLLRLSRRGVVGCCPFQAHCWPFTSMRRENREKNSVRWEDLETSVKQTHGWARAESSFTSPAAGYGWELDEKEAFGTTRHLQLIIGFCLDTLWFFPPCYSP